jgi:hypothetical protein
MSLAPLAAALELRVKAILPPVGLATVLAKCTTVEAFLA